MLETIQSLCYISPLRYLCCLILLTGFEVRTHYYETFKLQFNLWNDVDSQFWLTLAVFLLLTDMIWDEFLPFDSHRAMTNAEMFYTITKAHSILKTAPEGAVMWKDASASVSFLAEAALWITWKLSIQCCFENSRGNKLTFSDLILHPLFFSKLTSPV